MVELTIVLYGVSDSKSTKIHDRHNQVLENSYDYEFVLDNIRLPQDSANIPNIIGWSGPARSGTSALLFLLAGHPQIDRVYFQPQKTLMRFGRPSLNFYSGDKRVCMKEIFYSSTTTNPHDPIQVLLDAGVPEEKITWGFILRDPLQTYASWGRTGTKTGTTLDPYTFSFWQSHTINLWHKYKHTNVNVIPFAYELLAGAEEGVLKKFLAKAGIDTTSLQLDFNKKSIDAKLVPGQAIDKKYFDRYLKETIDRGRYIYTTNHYSVADEDARRVLILCQERYQMFLEQARQELKK